MKPRRSRSRKRRWILRRLRLPWSAAKRRKTKSQVPPQEARGPKEPPQSRKPKKQRKNKNRGITTVFSFSYKNYYDPEPVFACGVGILGYLNRKGRPRGRPTC